MEILAFQQFEKDRERLKRIDDREQCRKCADEQGQYLRGLEFADPRLAYFVIIRLVDGGASLGAAGEITKVNQAFQPSGRCSAANSL